MSCRGAASIVIGALTCAWLMTPQLARGDAAQAEIRAVVGGHGDARQGLLIGASGQVFEPDDARPGTWRRRFEGGIGVPVRGAIEVEAGRLFASGAVAPVFRLDQAVWHAHPLPNRGRTILARGGGPALAVGRHVYVWRESRWDRLATLGARVTALWPDERGRVLAATVKKQLVRIQPSGAKTPIRLSLADDDHVSSLVGHPGAQVYAISQQGAILRVGARAATLVTRDPKWAAWEPQAAAVDHAGILWLLGWTAGTDAAPAEALLARVEGRAFAIQQPISGLAAGDRFRVLHIDSDRRMLFSTASGLVRFSSRPVAPATSEGTPGDLSWLDATLLGEAPIPVSGFPARAPAHTR